MFGIGLPEFILIMALALIVVGPDKLPGLAKTVAKQILELKKAANSLKDSLQDELAEEKESLKELTSGFEDVDVSLAHLTNAKRKVEADIYPPQAAKNVGESAQQTEEAAAVSDLSGDNVEEEAAPKP
ncbi:MAG: twin-arginine translocase TatA/TatE family subunit [Proteobacteria bacterium]|nr:twin-arginine translocase TatA/TatE family subunit [Pseudomonadota bacterium]MBU1639455.1 twin-arginine translocase TatA/TatE family subunit [Pseudomonadota bacterium]